jgi:hypothetical protein
VQEDVLFLQLGARRLRDDLNRFLWTDKPHVAVRDLVEWTRKYLYLPRVATDQVILNALVNPQAALTVKQPSTSLMVSMRARGATSA